VPARDPKQCLGTLVAITTGDAPGMEWVEARDTAQHLAGYRTPTQRRRQVTGWVGQVWTNELKAPGWGEVL
jgi:hypothetical protein